MMGTHTGSTYDDWNHVHTSLRHRIFTAAAASVTVLGLVLVGASSASAHDRGDSGRGGPFGALVKAGTITTAQAQAVKEALKGSREESRDQREQERQALLDQVLDGLVTDGTLTGAQASALRTADRSDLRDLVAAGTLTRQALAAIRDAMHAAIEAGRADHQASKAANLAAVLADLVTDGTLTQSQATAISQSISQAFAERKAGR